MPMEGECSDVTVPLICNVCDVVKTTRRALKHHIKKHKRFIKMMVPLNVVGRIIGKSGEVIKSIGRETGTKLQFMPEIKGIFRELVVSGQKDKVEKARELVVKASLYPSLYTSMDSFLVSSTAPLVQSSESHETPETLKATAEDAPLFVIAPVACPPPPLAQQPETPEGSNPDLDLPLYLLEEGWRKCWSQSRSHHYYFNLKTGQTLWYLLEGIAVKGSAHHEEYSERKMLENMSNIKADIKLE